MSRSVYIVLFRGINIGGRVAKMATLRQALEAAGLGDVKTYIQSGNVVLISDSSLDEVSQLVESTFREAFGYSSRPSVRSKAQWQAVIDENPFTGVLEEGRRLHAVIVDGEPSTEAIEGLRALATTEQIEPREGVVYLYTPDGFGASAVAASLDKLLKGVPWTARNWNTVLKLQEMAEAAASS